MNKKSNSNSDRSPQRLFGSLGTLIMGIFIFFFMLLPGGLITFHAVSDLLQQLNATATLPALTGSLMAVLLGSLLFLTGCFLLWKIIQPSSHSPEAS